MSDLAHTLDYYLADPFNHTINQDLERIGYTDPLTFFHVFYYWVSLVEQGRSSEAIEAIERLDQPGGLKLFIVYHLRNRVRGPTYNGAIPAPESSVPAGSLMYLDNEYARLESLYPPSFFPEDGISQSDAKARQAVWGCDIVEQVMGNMLKSAIAEGEKRRALELEIRQSERERMQAELSEMMKATLAATERPKRNPEFTTNRQVLALGYMLEHLGVKNVDKTTQADFIEFLIGKNNKDIYDKLREIHDQVFYRGGSDAQYVRDWFQKLNLSEIVKEFDTLLDKKRSSEKL